MTGQALNLGLNHWGWSQNMLKILSGKLGCSASMLGSTVSSTVGGSIVSALIAYGMYFAGYSDIETANLTFVAGSLSVLVGAATKFGMFSLARSIGTTSTGIPISTLHGEAARRAILAWLGGGAKSAGGGGVAVGKMVVGGVVIIAAVATSYAVYAVYNTVVENKDRERIQILLDKLSNASDKEWQFMLKNNHMLDSRL